ncbi:MAG: ribosome silencing factor [Clostridiales bacterium]|nr:ribosome silencing factor [Clostridiales bacterium]
MQDNTIVQQLSQALYDNKGRNIVALDVHELTVICDWMVIASGRNANQVKALADDVDECAAKLGLPLRRSEGQTDGRWVILDYGHIIVHIFHQEDREYYNLERLWEDGNNRVVLPFDQTIPD